MCHPDMNYGPLDQQLNALPLSYTPTTQLGLCSTDIVIHYYCETLTHPLRIIYINAKNICEQVSKHISLPFTKHTEHLSKKLHISTHMNNLRI